MLLMAFYASLSKWYPKLSLSGSLVKETSFAICNDSWFAYMRITIANGIEAQDEIEYSVNAYYLVRKFLSSIPSAS
jgi:hypothetical protein